MAHETSVVAQRIKEIREREGLSRQQLADRLGFSRLYIWRVETGAIAVPVDAVADFAKALDVSVASLFRKAKAS